MSDFSYDVNRARDEYQLLGDDILYNLIINLRDNKMGFADLADELGVTTEELLSKLTEAKKDVFVGIEAIGALEQLGIYKDHSRLGKRRLYEKR